MLRLYAIWILASIRILLFFKLIDTQVSHCLLWGKRDLRNICLILVNPQCDWTHIMRGFLSISEKKKKKHPKGHYGQTHRRICPHLFLWCPSKQQTSWSKELQSQCFLLLGPFQESIHLSRSDITGPCQWNKMRQRLSAKSKHCFFPFPNDFPHTRELVYLDL